MPSEVVRVTFCPCSGDLGATPSTADGSVSAKIRADASVSEILRRLGRKFPQFATGQRLALLPPEGEQRAAGSGEAGNGLQRQLQELTSAQQLRGGERLLVLSDRPPACEQGRPADTVEARVWDTALPLELLDALTTELTRNHRAATASSLPGEKMHTWWVSLDPHGGATHPCPSETVPAAIRHLHRLAFGAASGWQGEPPIGAEWWVRDHSHLVLALSPFILLCVSCPPVKKIAPHLEIVGNPNGDSEFPARNHGMIANAS